MKYSLNILLFNNIAKKKPFYFTHVETQADIIQTPSPCFPKIALCYVCEKTLVLWTIGSPCLDWKWMNKLHI